LDFGVRGGSMGCEWIVLSPEGSGATDMTLMRHRIRQYSDGVGVVEDNVALIVSIAGQHQRMRTLDARVRACADRINEPRTSPRKVRYTVFVFRLQRCILCGLSALR
jgi:hypothetical protein